MDLIRMVNSTLRLSNNLLKFNTGKAQLLYMEAIPSPNIY